MSLSIFIDSGYLIALARKRDKFHNVALFQGYGRKSGQNV